MTAGIRVDLDVDTRYRSEDGQYFTQSLFLETKYDTERALYTLKPKDYTFKGKLYPSIRRLYLEMEDPLEYTFACTYFDCWEHWVRITQNMAVSKHIESMREELLVKMRAKAIKSIMAQSRTDKGFAAAKWLAEQSWIQQPKGRPSKAAVQKEAKRQQAINDLLQDDAERMLEEFGRPGKSH